MAVIKIPTDEILEQANKVRDMGLELAREADKLWKMSKPTIESTNRKETGKGEVESAKKKN